MLLDEYRCCLLRSANVQEVWPIYPALQQASEQRNRYTTPAHSPFSIRGPRVVNILLNFFSLKNGVTAISCWAATGFTFSLMMLDSCWVSLRNVCRFCSWTNNLILVVSWSMLLGLLCRYFSVHFLIICSTMDCGNWLLDITWSMQSISTW